VTRVIEYLAELRGGVDPRYDMTLRTYERSLRRFTRYLASSAGDGGAAREPTEAVMEEYLQAVNEGRWPAPVSERGIARTVMNHLKAFLLREKSAG